MHGLTLAFICILRVAIIRYVCVLRGYVLQIKVKMVIRVKMRIQVHVADQGARLCR